MASSTRRYCINGLSTGQSYSWRLLSSDEYVSIDIKELAASPVRADSNAAALVSNFVKNINAKTSTVIATVDENIPKCFSITNVNGIEFDLFVGTSGAEPTDKISTVPFTYNPQIFLIGEKPILFAPHITSPQGGEVFNRGKVNITWDNNDPPSQDDEVSLSTVTHEIEYTDNYQGEETVWLTLKRRIAGTDTSYEWNVGKMVKSKTVRLRMRSKSTKHEAFADFSINGGAFAINVFDLIPPTIINPVPEVLYTDFILIVLDETLTKDTYHQKVRYTFEYSSHKRDIDWTVIINDVASGQNVIRWDVEELSPSDDYILRLTAKNAACSETQPPASDQIARVYVRDIRIQQSGTFIIDTLPPEAVLEIDNNKKVSAQLEQAINIFAEDATTKIEQIQLRECDATTELSLGDIDDPVSGGCDNEGDCPSLPQIVQDGLQFGKPIGFSSKTQWIFKDCSGLRKLEGLLTDSGGNTSLQQSTKVFLSAFDNPDLITDFIIVIENREKVTLEEGGGGSGCEVEVTTTIKIFEVAYLSTITGELWLLEPFARRLYTINQQLNKLFQFIQVIYLFAYDATADVGSVYRHNSTEPVLLQQFTSLSSITTGVGEFSSKMYFGFANGELWCFDGVAFTLLKVFDDSITTIFGDNQYLYIGFQFSTNLVLYNGTSFFTLSMAC